MSSWRTARSDDPDAAKGLARISSRQFPPGSPYGAFASYGWDDSRVSGMDRCAMARVGLPSDSGTLYADVATLAQDPRRDQRHKASRPRSGDEVPCASSDAFSFEAPGLDRLGELFA
jgi:hypothetical protein